MNYDYEVKITKTSKLLEVNNDMVHNFYYLVHGRIINENKTKYKKFRFVLFYDVFDLQEYWEDDDNENVVITKDMEKQYRDDLIFSMVDTIKSYNDTKDFYELCNDTIENYNKIN
jgi:hypothetical protein